MVCFHFPHFYFTYNFVVLQKAPASQLFSGAIPWRAIDRELSLQVVTLKDTNLLSGPVSTSDTFKTQMKHKKHSFCLDISRREEDGAQSIFLVWCIWSWLIWVSVWWLYLIGKIQVLDLLQGTSGGTNTVIWTRSYEQTLKNQIKKVL